MLIESYNNEFVEELIFTESNDLSGEIQIDIYPTLASGELEWFKGYDNFSKLITNSFEESEYQDYLVEQRWFGEFVVGYWNDFPLSHGNFQPAFLRTMELSILSNIESYLNPGGRLPKNYSEIIFVINENETQLEIGQQIAVGLSIATAPWARETAVNVSIVGILDSNKIKNVLLEEFFLEIVPHTRFAVPIM